jgi:hypothetical protein
MGKRGGRNSTSGQNRVESQPFSGTGLIRAFDKARFQGWCFRIRYGDAFPGQ